MKAQLTGTAELKRALAEFGINADKQLADIVRGTAQNVRTHAIRSIQKGPKTGAIYDSIFRTINGKAVPVGSRTGNNLSATHRASAPGEAPATDTGRLANSLKADIQGVNATVFTNVDYAPFLEFGTRKIEPRPFLFPALEQERPAWNRRLNNIVDQAAKGIIK
jgi:HK97 gp10 family phage protein